MSTEFHWTRFKALQIISHNGSFKTKPCERYSTSNSYQIYVATAPAFRLVDICFPLFRILNVFVAAPSFNTINTFLPSGVINAALDRLSISLDAILTEPGLTNFAGCAII